MLSAFPELRSLVMDRTAGGLARRILPEYPDFPESFPADWLRARPG
jgi:hypothetical protein